MTRPAHRNAHTITLRIGTVVAVGTSTIDVDVAGAPMTGVPQLASFTATVGARVLLLLDGGTAVAVGVVR